MCVPFFSFCLYSQFLFLLSLPLPFSNLSVLLLLFHVFSMRFPHFPPLVIPFLSLISICILLFISPYLSHMFIVLSSMFSYAVPLLFRVPPPFSFPLHVLHMSVLLLSFSSFTCFGFFLSLHFPHFCLVPSHFLIFLGCVPLIICLHLFLPVSFPVFPLCLSPLFSSFVLSLPHVSWLSVFACVSNCFLSSPLSSLPSSVCYRSPTCFIFLCVCSLSTFPFLMCFIISLISFSLFYKILYGFFFLFFPFCFSFSSIVSLFSSCSDFLMSLLILSICLLSLSCSYIF